jgi:hypothetical protein
MDVLRPPCGSVTAHEWHQYASIDCPGLSPQEAEAIRMVEVTEGITRRIRDTGEYPSSARLVCHPLAFSALQRVIMPDFITATGYDKTRLRVPVVIDDTVPVGCWRLELADGEVPPHD